MSGRRKNAVSASEARLPQGRRQLNSATAERRRRFKPPLRKSDSFFASDATPLAATAHSSDPDPPTFPISRSLDSRGQKQPHAAADAFLTRSGGRR